MEIDGNLFSIFCAKPIDLQSLDTKSGFNWDDWAGEKLTKKNWFLPRTDLFNSHF